MSTIHAGAFRGGRYQLGFLHLGPNSFGVECTETDVVGSKPVRLELHESLFTDEEMALVHSVLSLLETKFGEEHDRKEEELGLQGLKAPRDKVHALVREAETAKAEHDAIQPRLEIAAKEFARLDALKAIALNEQAQIENAKAQKLAAAQDLEVAVARLTEQHQAAEAQYATTILRKGEELAARQKEIADTEAELATKRAEKQKELLELESAKRALESEMQAKAAIVAALDAAAKVKASKDEASKETP